jgi:hypothetical protein
MSETATCAEDLRPLQSFPRWNHDCKSCCLFLCRSYYSLCCPSARSSGNLVRILSSDKVQPSPSFLLTKKASKHAREPCLQSR